MSNQNVPWANRGRGGFVGGAGRSATVTSASSSAASTPASEGEEKKPFPFGERIVRRSPTTNSPAPAPAPATTSTSSPFGERLKRASAAGGTNTSTSTTNAAPTATEEKTKEETKPNDEKKEEAKPNEEKKEETQNNNNAATSTAAEPDKKAEDSSSPIPAHLRKPPRTLRGAAPTDIFAERVSQLANSPRKDKIVYTPERKDLQSAPPVDTMDPTQIDDVLRLSVSGEALAMLSSTDDFNKLPSPAKESETSGPSGEASEVKEPASATTAAEEGSTNTSDVQSTATATATEDAVTDDIEIEVSEKEKELAKEGAFCEGASLLSAEAAEGLTVTECIDAIVKMAGSPRLECTSKTRALRKTGSRKPPTKRKSLLASSGRAASLEKFDYKPTMRKSDLEAQSSTSSPGEEKRTEGDAAPPAETAEPATSEPETAETRERAGSDSSKLATLRNAAGRQFTLSAQDLLKTSLKKATPATTEKSASTTNLDEGANLLSRLKRSGSVVKDEKKDEPQPPTFGNTLKKVMVKEEGPAASTLPVASKEEESGPAWARKRSQTAVPAQKKEEPPADSTPAWAKTLKRSQSTDVTKNDEGPKEEPQRPWAKNLKKSADKPQEEKAKEEPSQPAAAPAPAWAKNLKRSETVAAKEPEKPKEEPEQSGPAWAKNLKKATAPVEEKPKDEPAPTPTPAASGPAWAKKTSAAASPAPAAAAKDEKAAAPAASSAPAWAKNLKKAAPAEEAKVEPAQAATTTAAATPAETPTSSVSAAAALFGGRAQRSVTTSSAGRGKP